VVLVEGERVRTAELIAALSLATDVGIGLPVENGLWSTLVGMRVAERLGADAETASQTYYVCLLAYVGCTADAEVAAEVFGADDALIKHFNSVMFGSRAQVVAGVIRALQTPGSPPLVRALQVARGLPKAAGGQGRHLTAMCEVARMLTDRLGLPATVQVLFSSLAERWDGKGFPGAMRGDEIPLALRIAHVARDACLQAELGGVDYAAKVIHERAGGAFDPAIATLLADEADEVLGLDHEGSVWDEVLAGEPDPRLQLHGEAIDRALAAIGDFADLASPYLTGHSAGVTWLATAAGQLCRVGGLDVAALRRAALVHDVGRVAVPARVWQTPKALNADDWERVRLHPYHTDRILSRSAFLGKLAPIATLHHERLDGSGYHRGATVSSLPLPARLLAAADAYHAMTEPRAHREALPPERAAQLLDQEARAGKLDADAVAAVLEAAGHRAPAIHRPAGLTEREAQVVGLLAGGQQTKQIARRLGISPKTADRHVQNAYAKIGVSTRAAAALFAMEHGLVAWGELPMGGHAGRS
jgi:HD-GYP domain-containing protein (c-di-GMP phosphodiesterase class II)